MGLDDRDYMRERAKARMDAKAPSDFYYNPKEFRTETFKAGPLRVERHSDAAGPAPTRGTPAPISWLLAATFGFLLCCLAGLLDWRIFGWGIETMKPVARWIVSL